jgi:transposase-like protein
MTYQTDSIAIANVIVIEKLAAVCPHCDERQTGWVADPRGGEYTCDHCGKWYRVSSDPLFRFFI